jgi:membrane-associated phospholipid phosphatase
MIALFCVGHVVYMLVPGYGPYRAMADHFQNGLPPGLWLDMVVSTVSSGGAQKDIFPSLHTAFPTFVALLSFRHRHRFPFSLSWPIVTLVALNIIIATMFLRWHYVIDVVAGLALAGAALAASSYLTRAELPKRDARGLMPVWPLFERRQA